MLSENLVIKKYIIFEYNKSMNVMVRIDISFWIKIHGLRNGSWFGVLYTVVDACRKLRVRKEREHCD